MSEVDINEIKEFLPHRYPFLMLDRVISVEPGKSLVAIKNVTVNEPCFMGHFPDMPVMPGVLIIEALAQASGILIFKTLGRMREKDELFYLVGIDNARFKKMVVPGDTMYLEIELLKERSGLWKFRGTAKVEGEVACVAEFMNIKGS